MDFLEITSNEMVFRDLDKNQRRNKNRLIKYFGNDFSFWNYKKRIKPIGRYVDLDIVCFFKDRLKLVETLNELLFLQLTFKELSTVINTTTYFYCVYFFIMFIRENELEHYIEYKDIFYQEEVICFLDKLAEIEKYKRVLDALELNTESSFNSTYLIGGSTF